MRQSHEAPNGLIGLKSYNSGGLTDHPPPKGYQAVETPHRALNVMMPLQRWKIIVHAINKDHYAKGRVIFDIVNEPDVHGLRWEESS